MDNLYDDLDKNEVSQKSGIARRQDLKHVYSQFFEDFRVHLTEFVRDNMIDAEMEEAVVAEKPVVLHNTPIRVHLTIKNQGNQPCFLTTNNMNGYRLDPSEKVSFSTNKTVTAVTVSGTTSIGLIRS